MMVIFSLNLFISIGLFFWCRTRITRPIEQAVQTIEKVASENLVIQIDQKTEQLLEIQRLKQAAQSMLDKLLALFQGLNTKSSELNHFAKELSKTADSVKKQSSYQNHASTAMAAALEQLTASIQQIAQLGENAKYTAEVSQSCAKAGQKAIDQLIQETATINASVQQTAQHAFSLNTDSAKISNVTQVIKDVAGQTNLLALNAAIEAARAGESGRGFAVVADEVRKLAETTDRSTEEISEMIAAIQKGSNTMGETIQASVHVLAKTASLREEAAEKINEIRGRSQEVKSIIAELSSALGEQSSASLDISQKIDMLVRAIEDNDQAMHSVSETANTLTHIAHTLNEEIKVFTI